MKYSPEVRERAVRMVLEHQGAHSSRWAAIESITKKTGRTAETLYNWLRRNERDQGQRSGLSSTEQARIKTLEHENREVLQARKASEYFSLTELDRRPKP